MSGTSISIPPCRDLTAKYFGIDHNRCILCGLCATCDEIEGVHTLDVAYRCIRNRIVVIC